MSPLNNQELQHLLSVERDLRAAEERMSTQLLHLADLRRDGRDTSHAEERLRVIAASVELLRLHAQFVRERIA